MLLASFGEHLDPFIGRQGPFKRLAGLASVGRFFTRKHSLLWLPGAYCLCQGTVVKIDGHRWTQLAVFQVRSMRALIKVPSFDLLPNSPLVDTTSMPENPRFLGVWSFGTLNKTRR